MKPRGVARIANAIVAPTCLVAALLVGAPGAGAEQARDVSLDSGVTADPVAVGLIVKYAPGAPIREGFGEPTGSDQVSAADVELGRALPGGLRTVPFETLQGAETAEAAAEQIERDPAVISAEPDWIITLDDVQPTMTTQAIQASPPWGLDRIDQRAGRDGNYTYGTTGAGVDAYVIDTGIRSTHTEFAGRMREGATFVNDGRGTEDCRGHGTHVAGTLGGSTYGVAKSVTLIPVRVFGCTGDSTTSLLVQGINWVRADHTGERPAVINMSLGGEQTSSFVDAAVDAAIADGIVVVVAAGNAKPGSSAVDACLASPARVPGAITVNASTTADRRASFSNFGSCTDIYAPGVGITSAWSTSNTATNTIQGTSMATPHVAGVVARILERRPAASPSEVWSTIDDLSTPLAISSGIAGDPQKMLYAESADLPPNPPVGVSLTPGLRSVTVTWDADPGTRADFYELEYTTDDVTWTAVSPTTQTRAIIDGLEPEFLYSVRVRAVTTGPLGGMSSWISSGFVRPLSAPAAERVDSPTNAKATLRGRQLNVRWAPPLLGDPLRYIVSVSIDGKPFARQGETSGTRMIVTLPSRETKVRIRVRAVDTFGKGPWSATVRATVTR